MDTTTEAGFAVPSDDHAQAETERGGAQQPARAARPTRRQFLKLAMMGSFGFALPQTFASQGYGPAARISTPANYAYLCTIGTRAVQAALNPLAAAQVAGPLTMFAQPLRGVGPGNIPVAVPDGVVKWGDKKVSHYTIDINEYTDQLHPDLPPTTLWGYHSRTNLGDGPGADNNQRHLSGIIVAERGQPLQLTFQNNLPNQHILPVDTSLMGADGAVNRAAVHLHGGKVPWLSDGGPYTWFEPAANGKGEAGYGPSVLDPKRGNLYKVLNKKLQPGQAEYYLPNDQSARLVWYHDHAIGITRLNAYAGIASAMIIRDNFESRLVRLNGLPDFIEKGGRELPIVIQDKLFLADGRLDYPAAYDPADLFLTPETRLPLPDVSIVPEMFGDTMLANGVVYPKVALEGTRYRLRILNACQARFLNLQLYVAGPDGVTPDLTQPGPDFLVLGTEGGFLGRPALVSASRQFAVLPTTDGSWNFQASLLTAPAERFDLVVDFTAYAGKSLILYNDAPTPFPNGGVDNYNTPGTSPNTQVIMRFDVGAAVAAPRLRINPLTPLGFDSRSGTDPYLAPFLPAARFLPYRRRRLTLNELNDEYGRLIQMLGTNQPGAVEWDLDPEFGTTTYARMYTDPATETPRAGTIEIWEIANLTADTHPMHFHLVNVQLLSRQPFNTTIYNGTPTYTGPARGAEPYERGWKDTVQMHPGEVTTVVMKFDLPKVPFKVPMSPRTGGHEYVWHCHILEHEEHDMMRPLVVI